MRELTAHAGTRRVQAYGRGALLPVGRESLLVRLRLQPRDGAGPAGGRRVYRVRGSRSAEDADDGRGAGGEVLRRGVGRSAERGGGQALLRRLKELRDVGVTA